VAIGVVGTYDGSNKLNRVLSFRIVIISVISESRVKPDVAETVKELILDGVEQGKIKPDFNIKFGDEVSVEKPQRR
jgi:hypothetical protein